MSISEGKDGKLDRRVQKTKKAIYNALFGLMKEKPFDLISVTELAERANINRKTFYSHYATIPDVLDESMNETAYTLSVLIKELTPEYEILAPRYILRFLSLLMEDKNNPIKDVLRSQNSGLLLKKLTEVIQSAIIQEFKRTNSLPDIAEEYYSMIGSYIASGILSVYSEWVVSSYEMDLDHVSALLSSMITSGLNGFKKTE